MEASEPVSTREKSQTRLIVRNRNEVLMKGLNTNSLRSLKGWQNPQSPQSFSAGCVVLGVWCFERYFDF